MHIQTTKNSAKLIATTGYATAGKDAFADMLVEEFGYTKVGFADKICEFALQQDPLIWRFPWPIRLSRLVKSQGWTRAKRIKPVRRLLQKIGTDARDVFGEDFWINQTEPKVTELLQKGTSVVITNCRFKNEAEFVERLGGCVVLVARPGVGPVNKHVSEGGEAFKYAVFRVMNDRGLENLREWARACHAAVHGSHVNPIANMMPLAAAIQRAVASGVELILDAAAPASVESMQWRKRHRLELMPVDDNIVVSVDGEVAGNVHYDNNIVKIDVVIAR